MGYMENVWLRAQPYFHMTYRMLHTLLFLSNKPHLPWWSLLVNLRRVADF